eukprot:403340628
MKSKNKDQPSQLRSQRERKDQVQSNKKDSSSSSSSSSNSSSSEEEYKNSKSIIKVENLRPSSASKSINVHPLSSRNQPTSHLQNKTIDLQQDQTQNQLQSNHLRTNSQGSRSKHQTLPKDEDEMNIFNSETKFRAIITEITDIEQVSEIEQRKSKIYQDGVQEKLKYYHEKVNDLQQEIRHVDHMFDIRDKKIDNNFDLLMQQKEKVSKEMHDFTTLQTELYASLENKIRDLDYQQKSIDHFFKNNRNILDDFTQKLAKFEYQAEKKYEGLNEFIEKDFVNMQNTMKRIEEQIRSNMLNFNDLYQQLKITENRVEPAFKSIKNIDNFITQSLPFLIQLHVSDSLQEVLNVQDKFKLMHYDNRKMKELYEYINMISEQDDEKAFNKLTIDKTKAIVPLFHKRLDNLFHFMRQKEKGCMRFEYGRDWKLHMSEEQIDYIDKGYTLSLDTKFQQLQKAHNMILHREQQIREEVEDALKHKDQSNSRGVSKMGSRIMMQGGGADSGQVVFYKELIVARYSSKREKLVASFNARKNKAKEMKARSQQKQMLDKLMREQEELQSEDDISVSSSDEDSFQQETSINLTANQISTTFQQNKTVHGSLLLNTNSLHLQQRPLSKSKRELQQHLIEIKHLFDIDEASERLEENQSPSLQRKISIKKEERGISPKNKLALRSQSFLVPDQLKEKMQFLLQLGFKQTQKLQKKINKLVKIHKQQSIAQNGTLAKGLEKVKKAKTKFTDMVDYLDAKVNLQITEYNKNVQNLQVEFVEFKDNIQTEYVDFFKNRKRIRTEISVMTKETNERIDSFSGLIEKYGSNHDTMNQIIPIVVESLNLITKAFFKDNEERQLLSKKLKFQDIANDGYLLLENANQKTVNKLNSNKIGNGSEGSSPTKQLNQAKRDFIIDNIQNQGIPIECSLQSSIAKIAIHKPEIPLPELFTGSIFLKHLAHRNNDLTRSQVQQILESFNKRMETLIHAQSIFTDLQLTPKTMFDDFYLQFNSSGQIQRPASRHARILVPSQTQFTNNLIQGRLLDLNQSNKGLMNHQNNKSRNNSSLGISKSVGVNNFSSVNPQILNTISGIQGQHNNVNSLYKQKILQRIEMKTQKLESYQKERESMTNDYLNKTFDDIQASQLFGNTATSLANDLHSLDTLNNSGLQIMNHNAKQIESINKQEKVSPDLRSSAMLLLQNAQISGNHQRISTGVQYMKSRNLVNQSFSSIRGQDLNRGQNTHIKRPTTSSEMNHKRNILSQSFTRAGGGFNQNPSKPGTSQLKRRQVNGNGLEQIQVLGAHNQQMQYEEMIKNTTYSQSFISAFKSNQNYIPTHQK